MEVHGETADGYRPHDGEEFMGERQRDYFRTLLVSWRDDILRTSGETLDELERSSLRDPDMADRAANESDWATELRTRDRQRKLLSKIRQALARLEDGEFGYCEVTGEPIPLGRLIARPTASMTIAAQEAHERFEKISRAA